MTDDFRKFSDVDSSLHKNVGRLIQFQSNKLSVISFTFWRTGIIVDIFDDRVEHIAYHVLNDEGNIVIVGQYNISDWLS